jgi:hypothetical protein
LVPSGAVTARALPFIARRTWKFNTGVGRVTTSGAVRGTRATGGAVVTRGAGGAVRVRGGTCRCAVGTRGASDLSCHRRVLRAIVPGLARASDGRATAAAVRTGGTRLALIGLVEVGGCAVGSRQARERRGGPSGLTLVHLQRDFTLVGGHWDAGAVVTRLARLRSRYRVAGCAGAVVSSPAHGTVADGLEVG